MNIWPAIVSVPARERRDIHIGFAANRFFCMGVEVRLAKRYSEHVIEISMWKRVADFANEEGTYRMIWTYSVENEHLDCKELEI